MPRSTASNRIDTATRAFADDVAYYLTLTPRQLPSRYLYDELGSSLFEAICRLPWYGIARAESRLLAVYGGEVFRRAGPLSTVVELGPGFIHMNNGKGADISLIGPTMMISAPGTIMINTPVLLPFTPSTG